MPIAVKCRKCGESYNVRDEVAGKQFKCKKCASVIRVPTSKRAGTEGDFLSSLDVVARAASNAPVYENEDEDDFHDPEVHKQDIAWYDIVRSPFHPEVNERAKRLTSVAPFWLIGGAVIGIACGFLAIPVTAALMPMFTDNLVIGLLIIGLAWTAPLIIYFAVMYSFYFSHYLAMCRQFGLGQRSTGVMTEITDMLGGGRLQLGLYIVILSFVAFLPLMIFHITVLVTLEIDLAETPLANPLVFALAALPYGFSLSYLPMAGAVLALKGSLNPWTVVVWIWACRRDYPLFVVVFAALTCIIEAVHQVLDLLFHLLMSIQAYAEFASMMRSAEYMPRYFAFLGSVFVAQYLTLAAFAMLGTLLRRNEHNIGFDVRRRRAAAAALREQQRERDAWQSSSS